MQNQTIEINSAAYLAGLRECVRLCDDRETAIKIYRELRAMAKELADKYELGAKKK